MLTNCPHCQQKLRYSDTQREKIVQALEKLEPGKKLTIKCPHCKGSIKLDNSGHPPVSGHELQPPEPPDLEWLKSGRFDMEEKVEDVPMALVLYADSSQGEHVAKAMKSVGYQVLTASTADEAMRRMQFVNFSCIVLHSELEGGGLASSTFHDYMRRMPMERRRYIFYIVIGPKFNTLYDLEALASSANLVVGENDLRYFDVVLRKAIPAYEELFGPMLEELATFGKR